MRLQEILQEGIHDPHIFKAIFVLGGPGSGKTFVSKKIVGGSGLRPVNVDDVYEHLRSRKDHIVGKGYDPELYKHSGIVTQKRMNKYVDGRLGLLLDGTGRKIGRLQDTKQKLENLGYDTMAIFINTDVNTALDRNEMRKRKVEKDIVKGIHDDLRKKLGDLQRIFSNNFLVVDNTDPEKVDFNYYSKQVDKFLSASPNNPAARDWISQQKQN